MSNTGLTARNCSRIGPCRGLHVGRRKNKQDRRKRCKLVQVGVQMGDTPQISECY